MQDRTTALLGQRVGHILIVDLIGEGGMGAVYVGFDDALKRKVAVKAIHSEFRLNEHAKARFLREARILSQLNHPDICTAYDFVEDEEADYLVLELVEGRNLREAMARGLSAEQKMSIACRVLGVLVDVHGHGVMHRDLKPENVMVTDANGVKVLDFGLARSVEEDRIVSSAVMTHRIDPVEEGGDDATVLVSPEGQSTYVKTRLGTIVGTAGYMSPEQARGEPATAASDVYSFGLILQELFTGEPPFKRGMTGRELLHAAASGERQPAAGLAPDLAALVERLTSLAPGARPSSTDALAALERIRDAPRRRRRRLLATVAWAVLVVLTIGMAAQSYRAARETDRANREAETARLAQSEAEEVSRFLIGLFEVSDPSQARGETVTVRELLDRSARNMGTEFADQPLVRARFMRTIGAVYTNLGLYDRAEPLLEQAVATCEEHRGDHEPELATSLSALGALRMKQGRFAEAIELFRRDLETRRSSNGLDETEVARCESDLGSAYYKQGMYSDAATLYRSALEARQRLFGSEHLEVAKSWADIGGLELAQQHFDEAEQCYLRALTIEQETLGADHPSVARLYNNLGLAAAGLGRYDEAIEYHQHCLQIKLKVFGDEHPEVANTYHNIAELHRKLKHLDEAEAFHRRALEIRQKSLGLSHPDIADSLDMLGLVCQLKGRGGEAEDLYRRALAMRIETVGPDHPRVALTLSNMGYLYFVQGRYEEAEPLLLRALDIRDRVLGPENPTVADSLTVLGSVYAAQGRFLEAEPVFSRLLALREASLAADHPYLKWTRSEYAKVLRALGREDEAAELEAENEPTASQSGDSGESENGGR